MSQDISFIKKKLKGYQEISDVFDIDYHTHIQYISLKNGSEYFYEGGIYNGMGENYVTLKQKNRQWTVPISIKDKEGKQIYKTRFFQKINNDETNTSDIPYEEIIQNQQNIIETMTIQLKQSADTIYKMKQNETKYIKIIQQLKENKS